MTTQGRDNVMRANSSVGDCTQVWLNPDTSASRDQLVSWRNLVVIVHDCRRCMPFGCARRRLMVA